jgi:hypothetical protein
MALVAATGSFAADPRPPGNVYRIGWLAGEPAARSTADVQRAFRAGLDDLGWDSRRIEFVERWAHLRHERLPVIAASSSR